MNRFFNLLESIKNKSSSQPPKKGQKAVVYSQEENKKVYDEYGGEKKLMQDVEQDKCPKCGATVSFDPVSQKLKCGYCQGEFDIPSVHSDEIVLDFTLDKAKKWNDETRVSRCDSCGAEFVFDKDEFAKVCPFCESSSVTRLEDLEGIRPNAVVTFKLTNNQANENYAKWVKRRIFAPNAFRKKHDIGKFKGIYSPSWTYDSNTFSSYHGVVGDYYYVTVGSGKNRHTIRKVRYRSVSGSHDAYFDDVNINSSRQISDRDFGKLKPFGTTDSVSYNRKFLAGYTAEHYKKPLNNGWADALDIINSQIKSEIIASLHCDVVSRLDINTQYKDKTFKYVLLPIYIINHLFREKQYYTYINGHSGKTIGKAPVSAPKVIGFVLGLLAGISLITILLEFMGMINLIQ